MFVVWNPCARAELHQQKRTRAKTVFGHLKGSLKMTPASTTEPGTLFQCRIIQIGKKYLYGLHLAGIKIKLIGWFSLFISYYMYLWSVMKFGRVFPYLEVLHEVHLLPAVVVKVACHRVQHLKVKRKRFNLSFVWKLATTVRTGRRVLSFPLTIAVHKCSTVWEPLYFSINYRVRTGHANPQSHKI